MGKKNKYHTPKEKKGFDWTLNIKESKQRVHFAPKTKNEGNAKKEANKKACRGKFELE